MKNHSIYGMMALAALTAGFTSCDDDKWAEGANISPHYPLKYFFNS